MNNYQARASRLRCFADITESDEEQNNSLFSTDIHEQEELETNGYFHCDAAQYEFYLHDLAHGIEEDDCSHHSSDHNNKSIDEAMQSHYPLPQMTMSP